MIARNTKELVEACNVSSEIWIPKGLENYIFDLKSRKYKEFKEIKKAIKDNNVKVRVIRES